jgi:hypothetical protein
MMRGAQDGGRFVSESRLTLAWTKRSNNNSGRFWSVTKMFLLGTRVNWVVSLLENIMWIHKGFHLARFLLINYPTRKR